MMRSDEQPSRALPSPPEPSDADIVGQFLTDTLITKLAVHERNDVAYMCLRRWRSQMKDYQVDALDAFKKRPGPLTVKSVSDEFSEVTSRILGLKTLVAVTPVPPGSSGRKNTFAQQIASSLAAAWGAEFADILVPGGVVPRGRSHPKKSAKLQPYSLRRVPTGLTLLVDDVATSGRHMELALSALRNQLVPAVGLCWIGP